MQLGFQLERCNIGSWFPQASNHFVSGGLGKRVPPAISPSERAPSNRTLLAHFPLMVNHRNCCFCVGCQQEQQSISVCRPQAAGVTGPQRAAALPGVQPVNHVSPAQLWALILGTDLQGQMP